MVVIGDSLTDGNGASPGRDQRWPDHLSRRLAPHGVAVLNAGISGNRLLRDGMGKSTLARFEHDALGYPGVVAVIVLLGTNDIGWPSSPRTHKSPPRPCRHSHMASNNWQTWAIAAAYASSPQPCRRSSVHSRTRRSKATSVHRRKPSARR